MGIEKCPEAVVTAVDGDSDNDGKDDDHDPCPFDPMDGCDCEVHLVEQPIYGLGRVGVSHPDIDIYVDQPANMVYTREIGEKSYELTDHLGNVRGVISDRKLINTLGSGEYYADVVSYTNAFPYGMPQPGRSWDSSTYRYGFNGMEGDPEVKLAGGHHMTTFFRQYDPRVARWWSNDPVTFPGRSPYEPMASSPVSFSDIEGDSAVGDGSAWPVGTKGMYRLEEGYHVDAEIIPNPNGEGNIIWLTETDADLVVVTGWRSPINRWLNPEPTPTYDISIADYMNERSVEEQERIRQENGNWLHQYARTIYDRANPTRRLDYDGEVTVDWNGMLVATDPGADLIDRLLSAKYKLDADILRYIEPLNVAMWGQTLDGEKVSAEEREGATVDVVAAMVTAGKGGPKKGGPKFKRGGQPPKGLGYHPSPTTLPGFPKARLVKSKTTVQGGGKKRTRWKDNKGRIYEWDFKKGEVEIYDKSGKSHLGGFDPNSGLQVSPANKNRRVEP